MTQKRYFINAFGNIEPVICAGTDNPDVVDTSYSTCFTYNSDTQEYISFRSMAYNNSYIIERTYTTYEGALQGKLSQLPADISIAGFHSLKDLTANQLRAFIEVAEAELNYLKSKLEEKLGN